MKTKLYIVIGMILLLAGVGFAITLNSYEDARSYLINYKSARENTIDTAVSKIKFTTDKICTLEYESEQTSYCEVFISADYNDEKIEQCFPVEEDTTKTEIIEMAKERIRERIDMMTPREEVKYIKEKLKNQEYSIK